MKPDELDETNKTNLSSIESLKRKLANINAEKPEEPEVKPEIPKPEPKPKQEPIKPKPSIITMTGKRVEKEPVIIPSTMNEEPTREPDVLDEPTIEHDILDEPTREPDGLDEPTIEHDILDEPTIEHDIPDESITEPLAYDHTTMITNVDDPIEASTVSELKPSMIPIETQIVLPKILKSRPDNVMYLAKTESKADDRIVDNTIASRYVPLENTEEEPIMNEEQPIKKHKIGMPKQPTVDVSLKGKSPKPPKSPKPRKPEKEKREIFSIRNILIVIGALLVIIAGFALYVWFNPTAGSDKQAEPAKTEVSKKATSSMQAPADDAATTTSDNTKSSTKSAPKEKTISSAKDVKSKLTAAAKVTHQPYKVATSAIGGGYTLGVITYFPDASTKTYMDYSITAPTTPKAVTKDAKAAQIETKLKKTLPTINKTITVIDKTKVTMATYKQDDGTYHTILIYAGHPFGYVATDKDNNMVNNVTTYYIQKVQKNN